MNVEAISSPGSLAQQSMKSAEMVDTARKNKDAKGAEQQAPEKSPKIQPEELIDQIKSLTEDGLYSVRFERDDQAKDLVVKIFDNETQKVIRQMPAEEMLKFKATFSELVGNLVDTKG
jgi:flagellar protein FlaG